MEQIDGREYIIELQSSLGQQQMWCNSGNSKAVSSYRLWSSYRWSASSFSSSSSPLQKLGHLHGYGPATAAAALAAAILISTIAPSSAVSQCDNEGTYSPSAQGSNPKLLRKRNTLDQASSLRQSAAAATESIPRPPRHDRRRRGTGAELERIRARQAEMLRRWEGDEDGWRELPARAWPPYQPDAEQMSAHRTGADAMGCRSGSSNNNNKEHGTMNSGGKKDSHDGINDDVCRELLFQIATTMVFYNVDPEAGLKQFRALAEQGHVDSMVACGVVLVEGLGVQPREKEGLDWLQKAVACNSSQACYELGTVYYTGIDGVVDENEEAAFALFERAVTTEDHTAALYMVADCLATGEGTGKDLARAVPLFYRAAERGHRFARQRIRELLKDEKYM
jgi:Sel1 repeat